MGLPAIASAGSTTVLTIDTYKPINILTWSFPINGPGKAKFGDFSFTKLIDSSSTKLMTDVVIGTHRTNAVLTVKNSAVSTSVPVLKYCFKDIVFTHFRSYGNHSSDTIEEDIGFNYASVVTAIAPTSDTGALLAPVRVGWNALTALGLANAAIISC